MGSADGSCAESLRQLICTFSHIIVCMLYNVSACDTMSSKFELTKEGLSLSVKLGAIWCAFKMCLSLFYIKSLKKLSCYPLFIPLYNEKLPPKVNYKVLLNSSTSRRICQLSFLLFFWEGNV